MLNAVDQKVRSPTSEAKIVPNDFDSYHLQKFMNLDRSLTIIYAAVILVKFFDVSDFVLIMILKFSIYTQWLGSWQK